MNKARNLFLCAAALIFFGDVYGGWLPQKKVFKYPDADLTWPAFAVRYTLPVAGHNLAEINIGDEFGIFRLDTDNSFLQFSIMGGAAARFDISRITNDLQIADYTLAFPIDYRVNLWGLRLMYWHTSSHIGDDYIKQHSVLSADLTKAVTDDIRLIADVYLADWIRIYQGYIYSFNVLPSTDKYFGFIYGFDIEKKLPSDRVEEARTYKSLFLSADLRAFERLGWQPSLSAKSGIRFAGEKSRADIFIQFSSGHLPYLGFMRNKETNWSAGFSFDM